MKLALAFLAVVARASTPQSPDDAMKSFHFADPALRIELVAAEPLVESPCAIAFDERGRLFVAENRGYPRTTEPPQGRIAMLEDTDGDGRMDKRTTFAEALTFPNGVMPWRGGIIVTCAPDVLFLKDNDGDGKADERKVLLTGFATSGSTQLRVNCPTLGPDGWIYFAAGLSGGEITAPGSGKPPVKMTGDLRWHPFTGEIENVDGRSQYGMSFDDFGRRFICMNRVPVQHVVMQSSWLRRNPNLAFSDTVQDCNERTVKTGLKGGGDGVRLFPISSNITTADSHAGSFSAACALTIWRGGAMPGAYRDCALTCDPTGNLVHADKLTPRGATFTAAPMFDGVEFLASRDDWFRPVFLTGGPDGALYIADMYRKVIEHPDYLPEEVRKHTDFETGKAMGRVWRVIGNKAQPARKTPAPDVAGKSPADFVKMLDEPNGWTRQTAFRILRESNARVDSELRQLIASDAPVAGRVAALQLHGVICQPDEVDELLLWEQLLSPEPRIRECALAIAANGRMKAFEFAEDRLLVQATDSDGRIRFLSAVLLGEIDDEQAPSALALTALISTHDRWSRAAVLSSLAGKEGAFLGKFFTECQRVDEDVESLLTAVGRSLADPDSLKKALEKNANVVAGFGRDGIGPAISALVLGAAEKGAIDATGKDAWLGTILAGLPAAVSNATQPKAERLLYVRLLAKTAWERAGSALRKIATSESDEDLRAAAISGLSRFAEPEVTATLLATGAWTKYTPAVRETVISALLANPAHVAGILDAIESSRLPASAIPTVRRNAFLKHGDAAVRARAEKVFATATPGERQKAFDDAKAALALKADAKHGRDLFKTHCATCHRLDREGHGVGPDLLDMRNQPKESILFHLIVPDAEIAPAYAAYLVETNDGRILSGILASETATSITLRGPLAQDTALLRTEIKKLEALPNSLMPAGLETVMSRRDLADLLGYLKGEAE